VVLPLRLGAGLPEDLRVAAPGLERLMVESLSRHAGFHVVTQADVSALMSQAARDQLLGCDAESCMAEVADAMDVDYVVSAQVDVVHAFIDYRAALLRRQGAVAVRRARIRVVGLVSLASSMDVVGRQLAGASGVDASDPRLARRLGTTEAEARELADRAGAGDVDLPAMWTETIIRRNRESEGWALLEGLLVMSGTAALGVGAVPVGMALGLWTGMIDSQGPDAAKYGVADQRLANGRYVFPPWGALCLPVVALPFLATSTALVALAGVVGWLDRQDRGRVPVSAEGCCRDDTRLREAERPSWGRRLAPLAAVAGGCGAVLAPLSAFGCTAACTSCRGCWGGVVPGLPVPAGVHLRLRGIALATSLTTITATAAAAALAAFLAAALLVGTDDYSMLDEPAPTSVAGE
jgi:hypothetical protein